MGNLNLNLLIVVYNMTVAPQPISSYTLKYTIDYMDILI